MNSEKQSRTKSQQGVAKRGGGPWSLRAVAVLLFLLLCANGLPAYSVLTHEEIVDLVWTTELSPLLLKRFPTLTEAQLKEAHGYAYGGAVIQDLPDYRAYVRTLTCDHNGCWPTEPQMIATYPPFTQHHIEWRSKIERTSNQRYTTQRALAEATIAHFLLRSAPTRSA